MRFTELFLVTLFLFHGAFTLHGQDTIRLNVTTFNPCDSTFDNELLVHLVKGNKKFYIADSLGTFHLPETGVYALKAFDNNLYRMADSVKLLTIFFGQNYDTLTRTTIMKGVAIVCVIPPQEPGWGYVCCDKLCQGYNVDYFDNGKKKIEGYFKDGLPIGPLTFYNKDGNKIQVHHYDKAGKGKLKKKETLP
jgi:hypothetical protein